MPSLTIWRICQARWAGTAFTGEGAALAPGRWNLAGRRMVYCAASRSLAALEILAHVEDRAFLSKAHFVCIPVTLDETLVQVPGRLPAGWQDQPPSAVSRDFGERFLRAAKKPALRVPSAVIPGEFNYLLNPLQAEFSRLVLGRPEPFSFDPRLAQRA